MWWMLARLINRRMRGSACSSSDQPDVLHDRAHAMPDMPMVACTIGALSLFTMAVEDGDARSLPIWHLRFRHAGSRSTPATSCSRSPAASS